MIKLVVFDFNGTLIDDTLACMAACNHILGMYGKRPVSLDEYRETNVIPSIDFYVMHGCDREKLLRDSEKLSDAFHEFYESKVRRVKSRRHALSVLKWLRKNRIRAMILSNHSANGVHYQLNRLGMRKYVSEVFVNDHLDNALKMRNKEEKLKKYVRKSPLKRSEIMVVGDTSEEIEAGRKLKIRTVAIAGGYDSIGRLKRSRPDFLIHDLSRLIGIIKGIAVRVE